MQGGVKGVACSSIPMNRLNQTESAVRFRIVDILMCLGKISKIRNNSFLDFLSPIKFY